MATAAVKMEKICKEYPGGVKALDNVDIEIKKGEWVAMMGPSGSGKTTLLNLIDGLDRPSSGRLTVFGAAIAHLKVDELTVFRRENIGLIFQAFYLVPYLTALENIMVAQYYHSMVDEVQARQALERVQLTERAEHLPAQLSGGEQQRLCIARALINEPKIILADEPTGNLDEANEERVLEILKNLHEEGRTLIMVTHDREIGRRAERIIELKHGRVV